MRQKTPNPELVTVESVRMRMVLPTTEMPVPERSVYNYIAQLGIEVHLQKLNDKGMPRRHVTKAEADQLLALFKAKHWRKFKAVEPKHKGD